MEILCGRVDDCCYLTFGGTIGELVVKCDTASLHNLPSMLRQLLSGFHERRAFKAKICVTVMLPQQL